MEADNTTETDWSNITYITMEAAIGLCAVVGNMSVIWVVKSNPTSRTTTFYFIVSLASADIAVGVSVTPLAIAVSSQVKMHFYACLFMSCVSSIFTHASIMSLSAIAVDRYSRVKSTVRYRTVTTQRRIWLFLGLCWLVSFSVGSTPMFGWNRKATLASSQNSSTLLCHFRSVVSLDYMVFFSFVTWILVPSVVMCVIYLDIFYIIRNKLSQNSSGFRETRAFYGREFKTAKSSFSVLFLFASCWSPLSIINFVSYFDVKIPDVAMCSGISLSHANSMMNPIVYACKIKKFKETYFSILRALRLCQTSDSLDSNMEQTTE